MILVTGASGLLGANFVQVARAAGRPVVAQYRQHPTEELGVTSIRADLTDAAAVSGLMEKARPAWVVHCAAAANVDWCEQHPDEARRINVDGSRMVAREARRAGARLVHISTDAVFDGARGNYAEDDTINPVNEYSRSKADAEVAVREELGAALIVRTTIYGWNFQPKQSLGEWLVAELSSGRSVIGFSDLVFSPLLVNHLSELLLEMMGRSLQGVYHVAASDSCTKYDFGKRMARKFGLDESLVRPGTTEDVPRPARRPRNLSLNTGKIARALGRTMPTVDEGIAAFDALRDTGFAARMKDRGPAHAQS
ncbi:MAG TPA: SDR family oxidoreductase [Terriglobales bacterium]|nr:SDR family oxidoreductase [Terriglobales bacterium]